MDKSISLVQSSIDQYESSIKIAEILVKEKLCACLHIIGPLTSVYQWQGRIVKEQEYLLSAKTPRTKVMALKARLLQLHPYETPEIIVLPIDDASEAYANWVCSLSTNI